METHALSIDSKIKALRRVMSKVSGFVSSVVLLFAVCDISVYRKILRTTLA